MTARASYRAFLVYWRCQAPWLGAHLKARLLSFDRISSSGFSLKKICTRFRSVLMTTSPPSKVQPSGASSVWRFSSSLMRASYRRMLALLLLSS